MGDVRDVHESQTNLDVRPGAVLGRYELLVPIAAGGMAQVWAARLLGQGGFSKIVALKMILPEFANDVEFRQMFLDEARIAAKLRHPNACETFDLGEHADTLFIAMEWVDGASMLRLLRVEGAGPASGEPSSFRKPIGPRIAARMIADACAGLHAAHDLVDDDGSDLRVVHRDISPHNLLVSAAGVAKVTDFGVAKALGKSHLTLTGQIKGKISYMAPEQLTAPASVDRRADVFALGCVLYEITTGHRPFPGTNDAQIVSAILLGQVAPPHKLDPAYPPQLEGIITRALAVDPAARYQTAEELRLAIEEYLASSGPPLGARAVAELVRERCAGELEQRREQVRAACARRNPSMPAPPHTPRRASLPDVGDHEHAKPMRPPAPSSADGSGSSLKSAAVAVTPRIDSRAALARAALAGLVLAVLVGGGAWYAYGRHTRNSAADRPAGLVAAANATAATGSGAPESNGANAQGSTVLTTAPGDRDPVAERITFRLTPPNAVLVVDGVVMPSGVDAVQRPATGRTVRVIVRAEHFEERTELVDSSTAAVLDIALTARTKTGKGRPTASATTKAATAANPGAAMPNPYE